MVTTFQSLSQPADAHPDLASPDNPLSTSWPLSFFKHRLMCGTSCLRESGYVFPVLAQWVREIVISLWRIFGGQKVRVDIPESSFDELTGATLDFEQVKQGMKTEDSAAWETEGRAMPCWTGKAGNKPRRKGDSSWPHVGSLHRKQPTLARCRIVVKDFATGGASALNSGIYAPTSSLDRLRCACSVSGRRP